MKTTEKVYIKLISVIKKIFKVSIYLYILKLKKLKLKKTLTGREEYYAKDGTLSLQLLSL